MEERARRNKSTGAREKVCEISVHAVPQLMEWNIHYSSKKKARCATCQERDRHTGRERQECSLHTYTLSDLQYECLCCAHFLPLALSHSLHTPLGHRNVRVVFFIALLFKVNARCGIRESRARYTFHRHTCVSVALALFYCHSNVK